MAKSLSVLFVTPEVYPLSKESGIADVSFSLPLALRDLGSDVRVMVPKYGNVSERKNRIHEINRLKGMPVQMGKIEEAATVKSSSINNPRTKVQAYITTNHTYFDQYKGVYHDPATGLEFPNIDERFIFFCKTVIETCRILNWYPDIVHCNDWQTAIVPAMAKLLYPKEFRKTKFVLTIHNFYHQGDFPASVYGKTGLPEKIKDEFLHKKRFNMLKAGILYADHITTVSQTYRDEIFLDKKFGNGLNSVLKQRIDDFTGILNGIDPWLWNPAKDEVIADKFKGDFEEYKYNNKVALINKFDLEFHPRIPLFAMSTKIEETKGIQLLIDSADKIFKENIHVVVHGQGENKELKASLNKLAKKYSKNLKVIYGIDDDLAHQMEAGSDFYIYANEFEPSGLKLMYSNIYGSVPIVHKTGGLYETVKPWDEKTGEGNAIVLDSYNASSLQKAIKRAVELFKEREKYSELAQRNMEIDYSWGDNAKEYNEIYKRLNKEL